MKHIVIPIVVILAFVGGGLLGLNVLQSPTENFGGVTVGNEYTATSTPITGSWTDQTLDVGWGSLGSVVVTKTGDLRWRLYDATSTNALINGNLTLDNQLLVEFPASMAVGTYTFDVTYNNGLVLDVVSGTFSTSTITFR